MSEYIFPQKVVDLIGDPFVLAASDNNYYMYGTSHIEQAGYHVWKSSDLENWEQIGRSFVNKNDDWAYKDFWAPEVVEYFGKFYMFYTAREKKRDILQIGLAVADNPVGPFSDSLKKPLLNVDYAVIDASVLIDDDSRIYLYFSKDCSVNIVDGFNRSDIYVVELNDKFEQISEPIFLFAPTQDWETKPVEEGWMWNEGASVIKNRDGIYYLTYSANPFWSYEYAIGLATSKCPTGPFEKYASNPILTGSIKQEISGTGHNSIFSSHDKTKTYIAYHVHKDFEKKGGDRSAIISEVVFKNKMMILK